MKKILALIITFALLFALGACSSSTSKTEETEDSAIDALEISFSSTFQQTETGGEVIQHFIDQLGEISDGAITVNISWGGTLFDSSGELDAVIDGAVNMIALGHMPHLDTLPTLSFPSFAPLSTSNALDFFNEIMFENEASASLVEAEAEAMGIKYLNVIASGANAYCAKYEFTDFESMLSGCSSFGNMDAAPFEALGLQVTSVAPPDTYDALNRGLIDATQMGLSPMVALAWYEVAEYWMLDGTYAAGNFFTVNLDWWNGLTAAQQDAIVQAADSAEKYSISMFDDSDAANISIVTDNGCTVVEMSEDDITRWWGVLFESKAADALARAETHDMVDDMKTILEVAAQFTGYGWEG